MYNGQERERLKKKQLMRAWKEISNLRFMLKIGYKKVFPYRGHDSTPCDIEPVLRNQLEKVMQAEAIIEPIAKADRIWFF